MRRSLRHAIPLVLLVAALLVVVVAGADAHSQAALDIRGNWWMVWGTVSGHTFTSHAKIGAYTSRGTATIVASGAKWRLTQGKFADSQGTTGTFTASRLTRTPSG